MIQVYDKNNLNYDRNGDITLEPQECVLYAMINGEIRIELLHRYDELGRWKHLQEENVIACPTPWSEKQLFRIYKKEKANKALRVYARHIYFDLRYEPIIDKRPTDKNGEDALAIILQGTKFTGHSNILIKETAYYVRKNVIAAISGEDENSFLNRWGGEILPDNFDIYIYDQIGKDRGVCATFGHNLKEIKETIDSNDIVTRIIPVGGDGLMLDGSTPWIDSENIGAYPMIKSRFVDYPDIKVKGSDSDTEGYATIEEAREALKAAAREDFLNGADEPVANYVVNMALLENTTEYKNYKMLEKVLLGDTVHCKHKGIEIDIKARCISIEWDCVRRKNRKIELGNYAQTYFDEQRETNKTVTQAAENTYTKEQVNKMINDYLEAVLKEGYVTETELNRILEEYSTTQQMQEFINTAINGYVPEETYNKKIQEIENRLQQLGV